MFDATLWCSILKIFESLFNDLCLLNRMSVIFYKETEELERRKTPIQSWN